MIFKKLKLIAFVISIGLLSSCASLVESIGPSSNDMIFDLIAISENEVKGRKVNFNLSVNVPRSSQVLNNEKILVKPRPSVIQYYRQIAWSDRIPKLVHRRLLQAFEDSKRVRSVGARADGFDSQYDLLIEIRDFQIEPSEKTPAKNGIQPLQVKVTFFAKLIYEQNAKVVRSTKITRIVEVGAETRQNIATAFNSAFGKATASLVKWTLK